MWRTSAWYVNNLPPKKKKTEKDAWVLCADALPWREKGLGFPKEKKAQAHCRLTQMRVRRFRGRKALRAVILRGMRSDENKVSVRCTRGETPYHRIAVVCGKNVARRATDRNRIKRILFESARSFLKDTETPIDCALIVYPGFECGSHKRKDIDAVLEAIRKARARI